MLDIIPHLEGKKHIIWDWNGTLLDDVDFCVEIIATMLSEHGLPSIDKTTYLQRFRFPISEYYEELGFSYEQVPFAELSKLFISRYKTGMHSRTQLYRGVREILEQLKTQGVVCSMLSAHHEDDLIVLLKEHGLRDYFFRVFGLGDHHAVSKVQRGQELMQELTTELALDPSTVIMVGDTDHDLEVAAAMGIDVLLLCEGHQDSDRLKALHRKVATRG